MIRTNPRIHEGHELGSRHMAAIGITAGSDAVCVVVSEETGTISVAYDGKLDRHLTDDDLRSKLLELVTAAGPRKPSAWGRRSKNLA